MTGLPEALPYEPPRPKRPVNFGLTLGMLGLWLLPARIGPHLGAYRWRMAIVAGIATPNTDMSMKAMANDVTFRPTPVNPYRSHSTTMTMMSASDTAVRSVAVATLNASRRAMSQ